MKRGEGTPATPLQVAMFGHIAAAIRKVMDAKGWKPGDLSQALGRPRGHTGIYHWLNAKGAPGRESLPVVAKALGLPEAALIKREVDGPQVEASPMVRIEGPLRTPQAAPTRPVLQFEVDGEGLARIRLDVSLPSVDAVPLLRMLLDAGMIMERGRV